MQRIVKQHPDLAQIITPYIPTMLANLNIINDSSIHSRGIVAVLWMLGEYGNDIESAPYIIEPLINHYEKIGSIKVKLELLTTVMKLFFKRPPGNTQLYRIHYFTNKSEYITLQTILNTLLSKQF